MSRSPQFVCGGHLQQQQVRRGGMALGSRCEAGATRPPPDDARVLGLPRRGYSLFFGGGMQIRVQLGYATHSPHFPSAFPSEYSSEYSYTPRPHSQLRATTRATSSTATAATATAYTNARCRGGEAPRPSACPASSWPLPGCGTSQPHQLARHAAPEHYTAQQLARSAWPPH